jgi:hypothetical protein
MKVFNFKTSSYFPATAVIFGVLLLPVGVILLFAYVAAGLAVLLTGIILLTTHYRLEIDLENKTFFDYVSFMGFLKSGERGRFDTVQYLFINTNRVSQTVNSRVSTMTVKKMVFDGYLKFSDENKIHITTKNYKDNLVKKLRPISDQLNIPIIDYTQGEEGVVIHPQKPEA